MKTNTSTKVPTKIIPASEVRLEDSIVTKSFLVRGAQIVSPVISITPNDGYGIVVIHTEAGGIHRLRPTTKITVKA